MKNFHPFFAIGTAGMIVIACLHIFFAVGLSLNVNHAVFFTLYPVFFAFLVLGIALTIKNQKGIS